MIRLFMNTFATPSQRSWSVLILGGLISILLGLLIIVVPEILIAFIASLFFIAGAGLLFWGWTIRKFQKKSDHITIHIND